MHHDIQDLSIVVPAFNEADVLPKFFEKICEILRDLPMPVELLVVDDGSTDGTLAICQDFKSSLGSDSNLTLRIISMGRNSGHMNALIAGLRLTKSEYVITMDADLQDPPELIPQMLNMLADNNVDVIQAVRKSRNADSFAKRQTAGFFYFFMKVLTGVRVIPHAADFRLMTKSVTQEIIERSENGSKVLRFLIPSLGFQSKFVEFDRVKRFAGESKYTFGKMLRLALNSIIGFSSMPLRIISKFGFVLVILFFLGSLIVIYLSLQDSVIPGWSSIVLLILMLHALTIAFIGIISLYLAELFDNQRKIRIISREL